MTNFTREDSFSAANYDWILKLGKEYVDMSNRGKYFLIILLIALGCTNVQSPNKMLEEKLTEYRNDPAYAAVQAKAKEKLNEWIGAGIEDVQILKECTWKVDEMVFFNSRKDRAYLLLPIQDNLEDAELDYVYVMYAALEDGQWNIYFAGLPNMVFPRERFGNKPISLAKLSELSRGELLKSYMDKNGKVNDAFVDKPYNEDLKAKQAKFLKKE